jgi:hypothetical protein
MFGDVADAKVEILWKDRTSRHVPYLVWIAGKQSRWRTPEGISLGTSLSMLQRANRRAFRMAGFAFDGSGTVVSWAGGRLTAASGSSCQMRLSLDPGRIDWRTRADRMAFEAVVGDRVFSSGHPAIQQLNPVVYKMFLDYGP